MAQIQKGLDAIIDQKNSEKLVQKLMLLHSDACKNDKGEMYVVALAETVISSLLKHKRYLQQELSNDFEFEEVLEENFLASPEMISARKYRGNVRGKIWDHKLQVTTI